MIEWMNTYCIELVFGLLFALPIGALICCGVYFGIADRVDRRRRRRHPFLMRDGEYEDLNRRRRQR
jgi:hypothetical protein